MRKTLLATLLVTAAASAFAQSRSASPLQKTTFQTGAPWSPAIDVRSDVAIVYGTSDRRDMTFEQRVQSWRDHGYQTAFMTGIAWGSYSDFFTGKWDGKNHLDLAQVERNGKPIMHGVNVPYVVPTEAFIKYMQEGVMKRVIDAGIKEIFLEEPEFWARGGYSEPFKAEWQKFYGFPWKPQHESAENTYLANKLKYQLYYRCIKEVSEYAKAYAKNKGTEVKVYIPTHSLVNYSSWRIVSPEASLASLPSIDGYIAQVWTGTSREPTYFNGKEKERVFENAFLEYGSMVSMTAPTKRKLFFLTDPIEDARRDWADYKRNYQATFTAKLLYPMVADYEVMPWPERIYTGKYRLANSDSSVYIPKYYSTQMQVMVNSLNDIPVSKNKVTGVNSIGVLMSNSLMFQRQPTHNGFEDPQFSIFYGQTLPLVKHGIPVQTVHMENLGYPATLKDIKVLVMSYSNMKPHAAEVHEQLAAWLKKGGVLIYIGKDDDPYQSVYEWWNTKGNNFKAPSQHLFKALGIDQDAKAGRYKIGTGSVYVMRDNPKDIVMKANNDADYLNIVKEAYEADGKAGKLTMKNNLYLERGPYDIVAVLNENEDTKPYVVKGPVIDLFDPELPVLAEKTVNPGEQAYLYNVKRVANRTRPQVLATAARIYDESSTGKQYTFTAKSPDNTINAMRILLPSKAAGIKLTNSKGQDVTSRSSWDASSNTLFLGFDNSTEGIKAVINW